MKLSELEKMDNMKVLLIGEPGGGKTCFSTSFPGKIYCFDFDGKINSAARFHKPDRVAQIEFDNYRADRNSGAFDEFEKKLNELEAASKSGTLQYKTIIVDSLTQFADSMLRSLMKKYPSKRYNVNLPSQQDYHLMSVEFKNTMLRIIGLDANVVVTAHVQVLKDDITGEILRMPQMSGVKLPKWLPTIFEEVYHCHRATKGTTVEYLAETKSERYSCRSQIPGLPAIITQDYSALTEENK